MWELKPLQDGRDPKPPKVAAPAFSVRELALGFVVVNAKGAAVSRVFSTFSGASRHCSLRNERAAYVDRPCLCCRKVFLSEGPHNRMCNACRNGNSELHQEVRPYITRGL